MRGRRRTKRHPAGGAARRAPTGAMREVGQRPLGRRRPRDLRGQEGAARRQQVPRQEDRQGYHL